MSEVQAKHRKQHHVNGAASSISHLEFKLHNYKDRKASARELAIEQAVIDEADKGELTLMRYMQALDGKRTGPKVDMWELFRRRLGNSRKGTFRWNDKHAVNECTRSYEYCKGHTVASTDILLTTTGNARCSEILDHWVNSERDYDIRCKCIIVFCDEAAKDVEINTWNAICAPGDMTKGVFLFCDQRQVPRSCRSRDHTDSLCRQLSPTNTFSKGKDAVQYLQQALGHLTAGSPDQRRVSAHFAQRAAENGNSISAFQSLGSELTSIAPMPLKVLKRRILQLRAS